MLLVAAWNVHTDGEFSPTITAEFLATCIKDGVVIQHKGVKKRLILSLGSSVADAIANAPINNQMSATAYDACLKCLEKGEYANGCVRLVGTSAPLRTDDDWYESAKKATDRGRPLHGIKPLVQSRFPLECLSGYSPSRSPVFDFNHSFCVYNNKLMASYIPPHMVIPNRKKPKAKYPRDEFPLGGEDNIVNEVAAINQELQTCWTLPAAYQRPLRRIQYFENCTMMELIHFNFIQARFVFYGRLPDEHYTAFFHNLITPLISAYGLAGECVLEEVYKMQLRIKCYIEWVRNNMGIGFISLVLHLLSHCDLIVNEAGGLRTNTMRYETANFFARCFVKGSKGQEEAMLTNFITPLLLQAQEKLIKVCSNEKKTMHAHTQFTQLL